MLNKNNKYIYVLLLLLTSCFSQKSPEVAPNITPPVREVERRSACEKVDYINKILNKDNLVNMFQCYFWTETYPHLYTSLKNIDSLSWNQIINPINDAFFSNLARRERVFEYTRSLDRSGGLDDLSFVLTSFFEKNFYNSLNDVFNCSETPNSEKCRSRDLIVSKSEIINIIKTIKLSKDELSDIAALARNFLSLLKNSETDENRESDLKSVISKIVFTDKFSKSRLDFLDALSQGARKNGIAEKDINVISKTLSTIYSETNEPWLKHFLNRPTFSTKKFLKLVRFTYLEKPNFLKDLKIIKSNFEEGLTCSGEGNYRLNIDLKETSLLMFEKIHTEKLLGLREHILHESYTLLPTAKFCPEVRHLPGTFLNGKGEIVESSADLVEQIATINDYFKEANFFDLAKYLVNNSQDDKDRESFLYLYEFLTGQVFASLNGLNKVVDNLSPKFLSVIFRVIKDMSSETYLLTDRALNIFYAPGFKQHMVDIAKLWAFYDNDEKNFIFKFVDRHFREEANFILLFDFYINLLNELPTVVPDMANQYVGDETKTEKTFSALKDIVSHFSGDDVLENLGRFFSRDQIIKLIEIIIRESNYSLNVSKITKKSSNYMKKYLENSNRVYYVLESSGSQAITNCVNEIISSGIDFYRAAVSLPKSCKNIKSTRLTHKLFGWMNFISKDFDESKIQIGKPDLSENIFDSEGLFSKNMLSSSVGILSILDKILAYKDENGRGLFYLLKVLKTQFLSTFFEGSDCDRGNKCQNLLGLSNNLFSFLNIFFNTDFKTNQKYRSRLVETITSPRNFMEIKQYLNHGTSILGDWAKWVDDGNLKETFEYPYDDKYSCQNFLNHNIGANPCESSSYIKKKVAEVLKWATVDYNFDGNTTARYFTRALLPAVGIKLPLNSKYQTPYVITLKEMTKAFYELTDKNFKINSKLMTYRQGDANRRRNSLAEKTEERVTTAERVEVTIRDVRFYKNFLGVNYKNAVTHAGLREYNKAVKSKIRLFKLCTSRFAKNCGRRITGDNYRLVRNAVKAIPSLLDLNTKKYNFAYGNLMQAIMGATVAGSLKSAQKPSLIPVTDDMQLLFHNGKIITNFAKLSLFSNGGRFVQDRVGRTQQEFYRFYNSERFNRVNSFLFKGFPQIETEKKVIQILTKIKVVRDDKGETIVDNMIDWVYGLDYSETRLLEEVLGKLLVIGTYLGPQNQHEKNYAGHSVYKLFNVVDILIDSWAASKKSFPKDKKLIDLFTPLNNILLFLLNGLENDTNQKYYHALNKTFNILEESLLEAPKNQKRGVELFVATLLNGNANSIFQKVVNGVYRYFETLHYDEDKLTGSKFSDFAHNSSLLINNDKYTMQPLRLYLQHTTLECKKHLSIGCAKNYHFDELATLTNYFTKIKKTTGEPYFSVMLNNLLKTEYDELKSFIDEIFSIVRLKKTIGVSPSLVP